MKKDLIFVWKSGNAFFAPIFGGILEEEDNDRNEKKSLPKNLHSTKTHSAFCSEQVWPLSSFSLSLSLILYLLLISLPLSLSHFLTLSLLLSLNSLSYFTSFSSYSLSPSLMISSISLSLKSLLLNLHPYLFPCLSLFESFSPNAPLTLLLIFGSSNIRMCNELICIVLNIIMV